MLVSAVETAKEGAAVAVEAEAAVVETARAA